MAAINLVGQQFNVVSAKEDYVRISSFGQRGGIWKCKIKLKDKEPDIDMPLKSALQYLILFKCPVLRENVSVGVRLAKLGIVYDDGEVGEAAVEDTPKQEVAWNTSIEMLLDTKLKNQLPNAKLLEIHVGDDFIVVNRNSKSQAKKLAKAKWLGDCTLERNNAQILIYKG
jgi:hypothetical protein